MLKFLQSDFTGPFMNISKSLYDFNKMFSQKTNDKMENILIAFLHSYELQRSLNIDQKSAFINSIKTPSTSLNVQQTRKLKRKDQKTTIEQKKKRSKKYMTLTRYQADIISLKKQV